MLQDKGFGQGEEEQQGTSRLRVESEDEKHLQGEEKGIYGRGTCWGRQEEQTHFAPRFAYVGNTKDGHFNHQ